VNPFRDGATGVGPEVLTRARSVVALHAHPDDESLATGGILALLAERGASVLLVTGTRGERGEVMPGPLKALEATAGLAELRQNELRGAVEALGIAQQVYLGTRPARATGKPGRRYEDSGMVWLSESVAGPAADAAASALSVAPLDEVAADVAAALATVDADLVITYNERGGYGHPDHVRMHDAGVLAARQLGIPVLLIEPIASAGTFAVDIGPVFDKKIAALRSHRSQLSVDGRQYTLSGAQVHEIETLEYVREYRADEAHQTKA
jgi:LmbE family N-acetylglucosaminyl deacetylase